MNLKAELQKAGVWHRFIEKAETVHTADAAAAAGLQLNRVTKSLIFLDENQQPVLAIIPGDCKVNKGKLKVALGCKDVGLVPFEQAEKYSGYPPGATPPVFHKRQMRVAIDKRLLAHETIFGGGGSRNKLIELKPADVVQLNGAVVADICE